MRKLSVTLRTALLMSLLIATHSARSMNIAYQAVDFVGQAAYAPVVMTGIGLGVGIKGITYGVQALASLGSLIVRHPKIASILTLYALFANNGQGLEYVQAQRPFIAALLQRMHNYPSIQHILHTTHTMGEHARAHLAANKELVALLVAPAVVAQAWDIMIGKYGLFVVEGICKEMVVPSVGGLYLANWAYDRAPHATTLYHNLLDCDHTLRDALLLEYSIGAINGWKVQADNIVVNFTEQIDREIAKIEELKQRLIEYVPNAPDMIKEAKKAGGMVTSQRHHSTEEREQKYWDWIAEKEKDPHSAKPNGWWIPTKKSLEALYSERSVKLPNIFWRIYWYYGPALKVYALLEQRKERLIGLRELVQTHFAYWWKEYQEIRKLTITE